jgi:hydrogenase expression/formation protein HypD
MAIHLALEHGAIVCTYGDTLRVPASAVATRPVADEGQGARRRHPHGLFSAGRRADLAREQPDREVVFFAIGFETTTPPTALVIRQAASRGLRNFSVLCCHVLTPRHHAHPRIGRGAAVRHGAHRRLRRPGARVSIVIGSAPYEHFAEEYRKPVVIAGFEPLDVMQAILMLVRQVNEGRAEVENEFTARRHARRQPARRRRWWPRSSSCASLRMARPGRGAVQRAEDPPRLRAVRRRAALRPGYRPVPDHKACECGAILRGVKQPTDCKLFGTVCTPGEPHGLVHGVERRRLRGALRLRPLQGHRGGPT